MRGVRSAGWNGGARERVSGLAGDAAGRVSAAARPSKFDHCRRSGSIVSPTESEDAASGGEGGLSEPESAEPRHGTSRSGCRETRPCSIVPALIRMRVPAHAEPHVVEAELLRGIADAPELPLTGELAWVPLHSATVGRTSRLPTYALILQAAPSGQVGDEELVAVVNRAASSAVRHLFGPDAKVVVRAARAGRPDLRIPSRGRPQTAAWTAPGGVTPPPTWCPSRSQCPTEGTRAPRQPPRGLRGIQRPGRRRPSFGGERPRPARVPVGPCQRRLRSRNRRSAALASGSAKGSVAMSAIAAICTRSRACGAS